MVAQSFAAVYEEDFTVPAKLRGLARNLQVLLPEKNIFFSFLKCCGKLTEGGPKALPNPPSRSLAGFFLYQLPAFPADTVKY